MEEFNVLVEAITKGPTSWSITSLTTYTKNILFIRSTGLGHQPVLARWVVEYQLWDEQRLTTWFDTFMPTLDLERPEVYQTMTDSAVWWVENTNIDGFRHDATKHIPEVFWRTLTHKVRSKQRQPLFQIGETYGAPELIRGYLSNGMLDAQFDFNSTTPWLRPFR